ncbi:MAG: RES family NAD+ phosphorylase [Actinomycetota bacterium]|nr:RES family NAD+ phosphorylase [Actinomycetota bacterium]
MARGPDPLTVTHPSGGNRFDPLTVNAGVLYFGTDLETCFGETLARLRPSTTMLSQVADEWRHRGFMDIGTVAADWRQRRSAVHVRLPGWATFLDVESAVTHQYLRSELALGLAALGVEDLDVATVRGPDRRVTRLIADWAYLADDDGEPLYAGIRYESRVRSGWECWAVFEDENLEFEVLEALPVTPDIMPPFRASPSRSVFASSDSKRTSTPSCRKGSLSRPRRATRGLCTRRLPL